MAQAKSKWRQLSVYKIIEDFFRYLRIRRM